MRLTGQKAEVDQIAERVRQINFCPKSVLMIGSPLFRFVATLMPATFVNSPAVASRQSRRLLSLAAVYDGMRRGEAARIGAKPCGTGFTGLASPTARARAGRAT